MAGRKACFVDYLALVLLIVGGLNWGLVGVIQKDLVTGIIGLGETAARGVYILVGLSGLWGLFSTLGRLK